MIRLGLLLETQIPIIVPWDYRTALTTAVYEILSAADPAYSHWLHEQGFRWGKQVYRLFVYSDLIVKPFHSSPDGLMDVRWMTWQISSPDKRFTDKFVEGLERKERTLEIFGTLVEVVDVVQTKPMDIGSGLIFRTISPIAVSIGDPSRSDHPIYLYPNDPKFVEMLERNLIMKWQAFHHKEWDGATFGIRVWNPRRKLVRVFNTNVRAWYLNLQMWGTDELIRFAYSTGLGIKNSQGFGMIEPGGNWL